MKKSSIRIAGMMTGTSCDGADISLVEYFFPTQKNKTQERQTLLFKNWKLLHTHSYPYPKKLKQSILTLQKPDHKIRLREFLKIEQELSLWYANLFNNFVDDLPKTLKPDLLSMHGQTIAHHPVAIGATSAASSKRWGSTLQLGDPQFVSTLTGITTVSHFRNGDIAAHGQGAPLVPLYHALLLNKLNIKKTTLHNLGGISNLTFIKPNQELLAFDTGPGNCWIDYAVSTYSKGKLNYDESGKLARKAAPDLQAVKKLLQHPYFKTLPPKSTGRDDFTFEHFDHCVKKDNLLQNISTATEATAQSIVLAYERFILNHGSLHEIIFCGGGARNKTLLETIQTLLPQTKVSTLEQYQIDSQNLESMAFTYFGLLALLGIPVGGKWTGVKTWGSPGNITPGKNWDQLIQKIARVKFKN
jgi:anhydro-N-acetylmuramic acid kinase